MTKWAPSHTILQIEPWFLMASCTQLPIISHMFDLVPSALTHMHSHMNLQMYTHRHTHLSIQSHTHLKPIKYASSQKRHWRASQQYAATVWVVGDWGGYEWCYLKQDRGAGGAMREERINRVTERRWEGRCLSGRVQSRGSERTTLTVWEGSDGGSWSCCVRGKNKKKNVTVWEIESWGRISSAEYLTFQLSISSKNHYCQWLG